MRRSLPSPHRPGLLLRKRVDARLSAHSVELLHAGQRVALHRRSHGRAAMLSDAASKVFAYLYLCLRATRPGGTLEFEPSQLAQQLGKSRSALARCLQELVREGVCRIEPAANQHRRSRLRICAPFWPWAELGALRATLGAS